MVNKIYIVGPVGSGKSTLAKKISKEFDFVYCELDSVVYEPDPTTDGNRKRAIADRDFLFNTAISNERWVVEDAGRAYFELAMQEADSIILLEPSVSVRARRIILRWIKQNLHVEKCGYVPGIPMLKLMFKWTRNYENGNDGVKERLARYQHKVSTLRTEHDIAMYINNYIAV